MPIHEVQQRNFHHLVMDIFWFGLALPATSRFVAIYAIRIGASPTEVTLLTSFPALILLFTASLSNFWNRHFPNASEATFLPGLGFRFSFLLPAFTPFFPHDFQPIWLILSIVIPAIPQGVASVSFLVMIREAVTSDTITDLISRRNFVMNLGLAFSSLVLGFWLTKAPFPYNYQAMFVVAFLITLVSLWHVKQTKSIFAAKTLAMQAPLKQTPLRDKRFFTIIFVALVSHIGFFAVFPLIPVYLMGTRGANEQFMSFFVLAELLGGALVCYHLPKFVRRFGNRRVIGAGMVGTALATFITINAPVLWMTLLGAFLNWGSWMAVGTCLYGYFTEKTSGEQITRYTIAYNQIIFVGTFIGPLIGSFLLNANLPIFTVLLIGSGLRLLAGVSIGSNRFSSRFVQQPAESVPVPVSAPGIITNQAA